MVLTRTGMGKHLVLLSQDEIAGYLHVCLVRAALVVLTSFAKSLLARLGLLCC